MKNIRAAIVDILVQIEKDESYAQLVLKKELEEFERQDRAFMTEVIYGTIKHRLTIDYIINSYSKVKVKKMKPLIRNLVRMSVYQIKYLDKVPNSAAINEAVKIVKRRKMGNLSGFVNGVLRNIERNIENIEYPSKEKDGIRYLETFYSIPAWIIEMWIKDYGFVRAESICKSLNERARVCVRVNPIKSTVDEMKKEFESLGIKVSEGELLPKQCLYVSGITSIAQMESFKEGKWTIQDESATLVGEVVSPKSGEVVLDMCSAPGGKSMHMAGLMKNKGQVISCDIHEHKVEIIKKNKERMGLEIIEPTLQDGTVCNKSWIGKFDKVLLDAPCSGLGILKRKPDIRYSKTKEDVEAIMEIQKQLISNAMRYIKEDGALIYSTCTLSKMENQGILKYALKELELELEDIHQYVPEKLQAYIEDKGALQILPDIAGTDGFFIARFRKRGNKSC